MTNRTFGAVHVMKAAQAVNQAISAISSTKFTTKHAHRMVSLVFVNRDIEKIGEKGELWTSCLQCPLGRSLH